MRRVWVSGLGGLLLVGVVYIISCNEPLPTTYGNPNTLDRKNLPGDGGAEPLVCTGDAGGRKFDGGDCPSFANDVYPFLVPTGKWRCSDTTCHGGTQIPLIDGKTPAGCYASLQKILVAGKPYIPGDGGANKDPNTTTLLCNLQGACGSRMPQAPGTDPTTAELCILDAWLRCGAPR